MPIPDLARMRTASTTAEKMKFAAAEDQLTSTTTTSSTPKTINEKPNKPPVTQLTVRQSILPLVLATLMLCLFSFSHGLSDVLSKRFQGAFHLSKSKSTGLQVAYFGAYLISAPTYAVYLVRRLGYKLTLVTGLCIAGAGACLFWPAGHVKSFGFFCAATFIMGSGAATICTSAIPFIVTCGPPKWSALRLNLVQSFQNLSSMLGTLFSSYVIFHDRKETTTEMLLTIQWIYLGVGLALITLGLVFCLVRLPDVTDEMLEEQANATTQESHWESKPFKRQYTLFWGIFAAGCFHGSEIAIHTFAMNFFTEVMHISDKKAAQRITIAKGVFTGSHFLVVIMMRYIKSRWLLLAAMSSVLICAATSIGVKGTGAFAILVINNFCLPSISPTIYTLSLRGLGKHTKRGASYLIASISAGIIFAPATGAVADRIGTQKSYVVPLAGLLMTWMFTLYVNFFKGEELDALAEDKVVGGEQKIERDEEPRKISTWTNAETVVDEDEEGMREKGKAKDVDDIGVANKTWSGF